MTPDWLKEIEARHSLPNEIREQDFDQLISALKLAIEGLTFYATIRSREEPAGHDAGTKAREILEKIAKLGSDAVKRGEG